MYRGGSSGATIFREATFVKGSFSEDKFLVGLCLRCTSLRKVLLIVASYWPPLLLATSVRKPWERIAGISQGYKTIIAHFDRGYVKVECREEQ